MLPPFKNEPVVNFNEEVHRQRMLEALRKVESALGKEYPLIIGCDEVKTSETFISINLPAFASDWTLRQSQPRAGRQSGAYRV
jgi:hypothetical protein